MTKRCDAGKLQNRMGQGYEVHCSYSTGPLHLGEGQYRGMVLGVGKMRNDVRAEQVDGLEHVPLVVQGRPK